MDPAQAALANQSRAHVPIAVVVATLTIATTAVILRSYTRLVIIKQFGYDDIGAIISLVSCPFSLESFPHGDRLMTKSSLLSGAALPWPLTPSMGLAIIFGQ